MNRVHAVRNVVAGVSVLVMILGGLSPLVGAVGAITPAGKAPVSPLGSPPRATMPVPKTAPGVGFSSSVQAKGPPPVPMAEMTGRRSATSRVIQNTDGSLTLQATTVPINYQTGSGLVPIDNTVAPVAGSPGLVGTSHNAWTVAFGQWNQGLTFKADGGEVTLAPVSTSGSAAQVTPTVTEPPKSLVGAAALAASPVPAPGVVTYSGAVPDVNVRDTVRSDGVAEDLILQSASAPTRFAFSVSGATLSATADGGATLSGPSGSPIQVAPPNVKTSDGSDVTVASGARYLVQGGQLSVTLDSGWLAAQPKTAFPITIDPQYSLQPPSGEVSYSNGAPPVTHTGDPLAVGNNSGTVWRAALNFGQYESFIGMGYRVYEAQLQFPGYNCSCSAPSSSPLKLYNQGAEPLSYSAVGLNVPLVTGPWTGAQVDVAADVDGWLTKGLTNQWFGVTADTSTFTNYSALLFTMTIFKPPPASQVSNLTNNQVLSTASPVLQATQIAENPDTKNAFRMYDYQITTGASPGSGLIIDSGKLCEDASTGPQCIPSQPGVPPWVVPAGALSEGVTYHAWVFTDWYGNVAQVPETVPSLSSGITFTIKLGLGNGGPSPTDQVGAVPGQASTPSQGAPNPGLPGSKATVNLVNGNLSVSFATPTLSTVSGGLALGFTYNSLAAHSEALNPGLNGTYYNDTNGDENSSLDHLINASDVVAGTRVDPVVNFDWGTGKAGVAAQNPSQAAARWSGTLTLPQAGLWALGDISSDGMNVNLTGANVTGLTGGAAVSDWGPHAAQPTPVFGPSFTVSLVGGSIVPSQVQVDWHHSSSGPAVAEMFAEYLGTSPPTIYQVPTSWLAHTPTVMPAGWTFNANANGVGWVGLADHGTSVTLFSSDGTGYEFVNTGGGNYTPPAQMATENLTVDSNGNFVLDDPSGLIYTFDHGGNLTSVVTAADDQHPAALKYLYDSSSPPLLASITDQVSGRSAQLYYGNDTHCPAPTTPFVAAPARMLCGVVFWDGTSTVLAYNGQGELARISDYVTSSNSTGIVYDLAYDSGERLTAVRDPLAYQAIQYSQRSDCLPTASSTPTCETQFAYDGSGRATSVTQAAPSVGAAQPSRIYCYGYTTANTATSLGCANPGTSVTSVGVASVYPSVGYDEQVHYDYRNRIVATDDSAGHVTSYSWDASDRLVSTTDPSGIENSTAYDSQGHPVTAYGPAPSTSFQSIGVPNVGANVPTATTQYDGGMSGLAAAWYTNPNVAGNPAYHTFSGLNENWPSPNSPSTGSGSPNLIPSSGFSGSLTGLATQTTPGGMSFNGDGGTVSVDGHTMVNQTGGPYAGAVRADQPSDWWRLGEGGGTTAADASGSNPGTYSSGVTLGPSQTGPMADGDSTSAAFNGTTGLVTVPDVPGLEKDSSQSFSVEAWVKTTNTGTDPIISKLNGSPTYKGWEVGLFSGAPYLLLSNNYGTNALFAVASTGVANGAWHQIAVTYNGNSLASGVQFFIDGNLVSSGTPFLNSLSGATTTSTAPLSLGGRTQSSAYFAGSIADASLYQGALSAGRVGTHFTQAGQMSAVATTPTIYNTPYPQAVGRDTPLSYWRMGETGGSTSAVDSFGQNPGTYSSGVTLGQAGTLVGDSATAAAFNGTTGMVTVPDTRLLRFDRNQPFTVEARIKTSVTTGQEIIASKLASSPSYTGWEVGLLNGKPYLTVIGSSPSSSLWQVGSTSVADGNWHQVDFTYDGSSSVTGVHFYVGGGLDTGSGTTELNSLASPSVSSAPLTLGSRGGTDFFSGTMSDVSVFNQALSAAQILSHGVASVTAPATGANVHRVTVADQQFAPGGHLIVTGASFDPNYGLVTQATDPDGKVTATSYSDPTHGIGPQFGLPTAVTQDPAGLNLTTTTSYETPSPTSYLRMVAKTLPAGNQTTYTNYGGTSGPIAPVCGVLTTTSQAGLVEQRTDPAPATGAGDAYVEQFVYDSSGRQVGNRIGTVSTIGSAGWACTAFDSVGRLASQSWPAVGAQAARTLTYSYNQNGNPLASFVTDNDPTWSLKYVSSVVDLLGRVVSYSDIWGNVTTTSFDQAGRQTGTNGPMGPITQTYDAATGRPTTMADFSTTLSTPTYDAYGRLQNVSYENGTSTGLLYDANGRQDAIGITDNQGATGEVDTFSAAGRIAYQSVFASGSFVDAAGSGPSYTYDGAGRLTQAVMPGVTYNYGYGTTTTCPSNVAGSNTNRTNLTLAGTGAGTTNYCYDNADRLTSTTSIPSGSITYDSHGNMIQDGNQSFTYDSSDRLVRSDSPTGVSLYAPDPLNRVAQRTTITPITAVATTSATTVLGTSVSLTTPTGTQPGDLILVSIATAAGSLQTPTGWSLVTSKANGSNQTWVLDHTVVTGDPGSWTFSDPTSTTLIGGATSYHNIGSTPIDVTAGVADGSATSQSLPTVTTSSNAETLIHVVGYNGAATGAAPTGDIQRGSTSSALASLLVSDRYQAQPGNSTAVSATSNVAAASEAITVALLPVSTTSRLGYSGESDNSGFTQNTSGTTTGLNISLPGGATDAVGPTGAVWSYSNLHGDTVTTTDGSGNRTWTGYWGPYGETASNNGQPANDIMPGTSFGYNGQQQKLSDTSAGIVFMGARPYQPSVGRFLQVDPVAGGCANAYTYAFGDPLNNPDLSGQGGCGGSWWDPFSSGSNSLADLGILLGAVAVGLTGVGLVVELGAGAAAAVAIGAAGAGAGAAYLDYGPCVKGHNDLACLGLGAGGAGAALSGIGALTGSGLAEAFGLNLGAAGVTLDVAGAFGGNASKGNSPKGSGGKGNGSSSC
jgi:RHS repeat-associated protein